MQAVSLAALHCLPSCALKEAASLKQNSTSCCSSRGLSSSGKCVAKQRLRLHHTSGCNFSTLAVLCLQLYAVDLQACPMP